MLANSVSFAFDLKGPSYTIASACSSSLIVLQEAFIMIKSGLIDDALVGGAQLCLDPNHWALYKSLNVLSSDGKCKFLDESADGFVVSESCSMIYLQRAHQAKRVYANILNVLSNNDGFKCDGMAHPSSEAQVVNQFITVENFLRLRGVYNFSLTPTPSPASDS